LVENSVEIDWSVMNWDQAHLARYLPFWMWLKPFYFYMKISRPRRGRGPCEVTNLGLEVRSVVPATASLKPWAIRVFK
jgi:hypothetical protein